MSIRVHKLNAEGQTVWVYEGELLAATPTMMQIQAFFARSDYVASYHTFRQGDRMVEWFYSDRWYNVFQMHDVDDDRLKGWYCNITRPARLEAHAIYAEDLALDLMVYPDGRFVVLDEDEFEALHLDDETAQHAQNALETLKNMVINRSEMFALIAC